MNKVKESALYEPCKRPRCTNVGAVADHVIVFGQQDEMRLPVCSECAVEALGQNLKVRAFTTLSCGHTVEVEPDGGEGYCPCVELLDPYEEEHDCGEDTCVCLPEDK